ncbi:MAG: hypothetical protein WC211_11480 [Dehalococcoidia bacterium]
MDASGFSALGAGLTALFTFGLLAVAFRSLTLARDAGLFQKDTEADRRRPSIALTLIDEASQQGTISASVFPLGDVSAEQQAAWAFWYGRARDRDPQDFDKYPQRKYRLMVDNAGPGAAVRVRVPFTLDIYQVESGPPRSKFLDSERRVAGAFDIFHIQPGQQRYSSLTIDASYFPAFEIKLGDPEIIGIGGQAYPKAWTDVGASYRNIEVDNDQLWSILRNAIWEPSRPASLTVALTAPVRREADAIVLPLQVSPVNSKGHPVSGSAFVTVFGTNVLLSSYTILVGSATEIRLPTTLPPADYYVSATMGSINNAILVKIP